MVTGGPAGRPGWLLGTALARWPEELRTELAAEWTAEITAIRQDGPGSPLGRRWRGFRFALSLALAPPVEPAGEPPRGWREHVLGAHRTVAGLVALLLVPMAAMITTEVARLPTLFLGTLLPAPADQITGSFTALACLLVAVLAGGRLAARRPLVPAGDWRHRALASTVGTALVLIVGVLLADRLPGIVDPTTQALSAWWSRALAVTVAVGFVAAVATTAAGRLVHGPRWRIVLVAALGGFLAADLGVAAAALPVVLAHGYPPASAFLWLPMDMFGNSMAALAVADDVGPSAFNPWLPFMTLLWLPKTLLFSTAFGLSYAARLQTLTGELLARPGAATRLAPRPLPDPDADRRALPGLLAGASAALLGILVWAAAGAGLLNTTQASPDDPDYFVAYVPDLRHAAIVLAVLGLAVAAAHVGSLVTPAVLLAVGLLGIDALLTANDLTGLRAAGAAAVLGTVLGCLALRLSPFLGQAPPAAAYRQRLTGLAVLAAFCAPAVPGHGEVGFIPPRPPTPVWLAALLVSACLVLIAGFCAVAARPTAPSPSNRTRLGAIAAVLALAVAMISTNGYGFLLGPVLGVGALALARHPGTFRRRAAARGLGFGALAAVAAMPAWLLTDQVGAMLDLPLIALNGSESAVAAVSAVFGAPAAGLVFMLLFGRRRRPEPETGAAVLLPR